MLSSASREPSADVYATHANSEQPAIEDTSAVWYRAARYSDTGGHTSRGTRRTLVLGPAQWRARHAACWSETSFSDATVVLVSRKVDSPRNLG